MSKNLKAHPYAAMLPMMSEPEYEALKSDVQAAGKFTDDAWLFEGKILDGRNRYRVSTETGIKLNFRPFKGTAADAIRFVYSKAVHRNMNDSQKAASAVNFLPHFQKDAEQRIKAGGKEPVPEGTKGQSRDFAGGLFGVSGRYVSDAKLIFDRDPKLFMEVFEGRMPITQAKRRIQRHERKREMTKKAKAAPAIAECNIITGDCIKVAETIPSNSVRLIFVDPPYNIGIDYGGGAKADLLPRERFVRWINDWIQECFRVLTKDGAIFIMISGEYLADVEMILRGVAPDGEDLEPFHRRNVIIWHETFGQHTAGNFTDCWRPILYYTRSKDDFVWHGDEIVIPSDRQTKYNDSRADEAGKVPTNVWQFPRVADNHPQRVTGFPTQIPQEIVERIVRVASDPGDTVMDLFTGSGTTAVAACLNGRKFIGAEKEKKNADAARLRVRAAMAERKA